MPPKDVTHLNVVKGHPIDGCVIHFQLSEVDVRLLAKGMVSSEVREQAAACLGWLSDEPWQFFDEDFLKLGRKQA